MGTFTRKKNLEQKIDEQPVHTGVRYKKRTYLEDIRRDRWTTLPSSKSGILFKFLQWFWKTKK